MIGHNKRIMKFSISVSALIQQISLIQLSKTNLNKKKKIFSFHSKPNYSTKIHIYIFVHTYRFFVFVEPSFGFHRDKITLTTSQLKKKKKKEKETKEQRAIAIKIQRAPFACRENSTSPTSSCSKTLPHSFENEANQWHGATISPRGEDRLKLKWARRKETGNSGRENWNVHVPPTRLYPSRSIVTRRLDYTAGIINTDWYICNRSERQPAGKW